jgi:cytochrome c-type biogenesis protein CcmE
MKRRQRKRLVIATVAIAAALVSLLAYFGSIGSSRAVALAAAASGQFNGQRVQVSGTVVADSFSNSGGTVNFALGDDETGDQEIRLEVEYQGQLAATFGTGTDAVCTGRIDENGVLQATELISKCPSKYESAEAAVTVGYLNEHAARLVNQEIRLAGYIKAETLAATADELHFVLYSQDGEVSVRLKGALAEAVQNTEAVVLSGALDSQGVFLATDVAAVQVGQG